MRRHPRTLVVSAALLAATTATALAGSHPNAANITINDATSASPYPSTIAITGEANPAGAVTVTLNGFDHSFPDDVDILLVGPTGDDAIILSDVCGGPNLTGPSDLTLDDAAIPPVPDAAACPTGTYKPTNSGAGDPFDAPAPTPSGNVTLATFALKNPNGTWSLYVMDDTAEDAGNITGGWALNITPPTAVGVRSFGAVQSGSQILLRWRTAGEQTLAGFNVYRSTSAGTKRLNRELIRARHAGTARGRSYALRDTTVRAGTSYTYRLETVRLDGSRARAGSSALRAR